LLVQVSRKVGTVNASNPLTFYSGPSHEHREVFHLQETGAIYWGDTAPHAIIPGVRVIDKGSKLWWGYKGKTVQPFGPWVERGQA
jgi:hypothetical protein